MLFTYYTNSQIIPFYVSAIILIASIIGFHNKKEYSSVWLLFIGSLCLGFFIANLDHFLQPWDEQYHALVAKNMLDNPFKPTLYCNPILEYDYKNWGNNHIWLHKQPLFLWQIALSLKLFGINEIAVRIPSIILHAITTILIYRIGKISCNTNIGYYGALFFAVAYYPLELVVGGYATDHNDIAFLFYVTASFWAWFEYQNSHKKNWLILIGLFSGCAVLVKWMVGLLIYPVWAIALIINNKGNISNSKQFLPAIYSLLLSILIFMPWQIFIFSHYPQEARYEFELNSRHFFEPIENHSGSFWFHFNAIKYLYGSGDAIPFLLLLGLYLLIKNSVARIYRVSILAAIIITYGFYSIAATKMTSFCIIVSPFAFMALGALADSVIKYLNAKINLKMFIAFFRPIALTAVCFFLINLSKIRNYHTEWKPNDNRNRKVSLKEMTFIKKLKDMLGNNKYVVFNANVRICGHIPVMFYTNYIAYDFIPDKRQIDSIKKQSYKIAILNMDSLPSFIQADDDIVKIKF